MDLKTTYINRVLDWIEFKFRLLRSILVLTKFSK